MNWSLGPDGVVARVQIAERRFARYLAVGLLIVFAPAAPVLYAQNFWTGEGSDNLWTTPENWSRNIEPTSGNVWVNGPEAAGNKGPVIEDGIDATVGSLFSDFGRPIMTMTGGTLTATKTISWGEITGTDAEFQMNGGVVDIEGEMRLGWQSLQDPLASAVGIWEMTGGDVTVESVSLGGGSGRGKGVLNLFGGTFNVIDRGTLEMFSRRQSVIELTEGVLTLSGDKSAQVQGYVDSGWIKAYDGDGEVGINFAGGVTTIVGIDPNPSIPGDYNENGELDSADLDLQSQAIKDQDLNFDLTIDGKVNFADREKWVHNLKGTWMGDSDLDGEFSSGDLVLVFAGGKYEKDQNAGWLQGDWGGDMRFGSSDLVTAFSDGGYEAGPRPAAAAVPEPSSMLLMCMALLGISRSRRRSRC